MGKINGYYIMPHPPIIVKEVGIGEEKKAKNTTDACLKLSEEIAHISPDTIILITPHGNLFRDAIAVIGGDSLNGDLGNFNAPEVVFNLKIDSALTSSIKNYAKGLNVPMVSIDKSNLSLYDVNLELDHGAMVPLYFINKNYNKYKLVHITYGLLASTDLYKFGIAIKLAVEASNTNAIVIASGDLSHKLSPKAPYGFSPYGKVFDENLLNLLKEGDILSIFNIDKDIIEAAGECGLRSFYILSGTMDELCPKGNLLSYEGPFGIGYGVMNFKIHGTSESLLKKIIGSDKEKMKMLRENEDVYVKLARETLEHYIKKGNVIKYPSYIPEEMLTEKRAVFVSLKKNGELRGCIGTISPTQNSLADEIIRNAIQAGEKDPRFQPVQEEELGEIVYSVDILTPPKKASKNDLDPKKYGVIVSCGYKSGLLLPDLSGIDTVADQLSIALKKAGISSSENYSIEKFEVIRHK